jgi:4-hydroxybenzoate polyprenyltransferase
VFLVFLATAYSLKPLRFKERGIMGVFASALTHGVLPFLVFAYSINLSWIIGTYFFIFMALTEFIGDLIHHISDFDNDEVTRTKTWIKEIGIEKSRKILKAMLIVLFFYPFVSFLFLKWEYGAIFAIVNFILAAHIYLEDLVGSF